MVCYFFATSTTSPPVFVGFDGNFNPINCRFEKNSKTIALKGSSIYSETCKAQQSSVFPAKAQQNATFRKNLLPFLLPFLLPTTKSSKTGSKAMGTITKKKRANGTVAYRAEVRKMVRGEQVFKEVKTFDSALEAKRWINRLENQIAKHGTPAPELETDNTSVGAIIRRYINEFEHTNPVQRSRRQALLGLADSWLGTLDARTLTTDLIRAFAQDRCKSGVSPVTVGTNFAYLSSVLKFAKPAWNMDVNDSVIRDARPMLKGLGLVSASGTRTRRPEGDEIPRLLELFRSRQASRNGKLPMADIVEFAMYSAMRQGEICHITWTDFDEVNRTIVIRNRKDPKKKQGNDQTIPLLGPAFDIVMRQPREGEFIFPYKPTSVCEAFIDACKTLEIEGLRFHDLRREAASRLMELGFTPPEVATITGHKTINILWSVYTKIKPEALHNKFDTLRRKNDE